MVKIRPYLRKEDKHSAPARELMNGILGQLRFDPGLFAAFEICDREIKKLIRECEVTAIQNSKI